MSWKEKMKEYGGADLGFLSEDGELINFVVVADPILLKGKFKGKETEKIGCPCVTEDGYQLLVIGKRLARRISKHEALFAETAFCAIRHGEQDDQNTTYELRVITDDDLTKRLLLSVEGAVDKETIEDSIEAAKEVMKG